MFFHTADLSPGQGKCFVGTPFVTDTSGDHAAWVKQNMVAVCGRNMEVSYNGGTRKWSVYKKHPMKIRMISSGTRIPGNPHMAKFIFCSLLQDDDGWYPNYAVHRI